MGSLDSAKGCAGHTPQVAGQPPQPSEGAMEDVHVRARSATPWNCHTLSTGHACVDTDHPHDGSCVYAPSTPLEDVHVRALACRRSHSWPAVPAASEHAPARSETRTAPATGWWDLRCGSKGGNLCLVEPCAQVLPQDVQGSLVSRRRRGSSASTATRATWTGQSWRGASMTRTPRSPTWCGRGVLRAVPHILRSTRFSAGSHIRTAASVAVHVASPKQMQPVCSPRLPRAWFSCVCRWPSTAACWTLRPGWTTCTPWASYMVWNVLLSCPAVTLRPTAQQDATANYCSMQTALHGSWRVCFGRIQLFRASTSPEIGELWGAASVARSI